LLGWIGSRPFTPGEVNALRQAARFAAAPLAALAARATLTAALEAYLGRRGAARVLAGPLRRDIGETIQAALLYADLRGFTALSESNQTCTAKMGHDAMSVVDGSLKVHGIDNLRIADGSIMPRVTTGNTMAPCVIIGERASEMLKIAHRT
jgi:adenylate cyclase